MNRTHLPTHARLASGHVIADSARALWSRLVVSMLALMLSGCGGGGSGGGGVSIPVPVLTTPVVTTQPAPVSVAVGASASFSVVASGNGLVYTWLRSTNNGQTFAEVPAATGARYTIASVDASMNGHQYRVIVSNPVGTTLSTPATLSVTVAVPGGGGGGGGGVVPAACVPSNVLPVGMVVRSTSAIETSGVPGTPQVATLTVVGPATFQGRSVFETSIDTSGTALPGVTRTFSTWDPASRQLTPWGVIARYTSGITVADITTVARQPAQYPVYALAVGESAAVTTVSDTTIVYTIDGSVSTPATGMETLTTTYTFLGTETITVPAGTFLTCKLRQQAAGQTQASTTWLMAGYGATVKFVAGTTTQTLTAITVDGAPLAQFP